ncbi:MAG: EAL domain-containing protein [Prochlorococcaceae cyanobacterium]|jgi:EAL domain-containing protein (putative c-di-GMP-specific phosphodiesterase class I)/CBS domain-containing protein
MDNSLGFDPAEALITDIILISPQATVAEALRQLSGESSCNSDAPAPGETKLQVSKLYAGCVFASSDGKTIEGILTERDFVRLAVEAVDLEDIAVSEVMTTAVITLRFTEFTDVFVAQNIFHQHRIRHIPVLREDGTIAGVVTNSSLQHALHQGHFLRLRTISEVMTRDVITVFDSARVEECAMKMIHQRISCVVVTRASGHDDGSLFPIGILTERDLLQLKNLQVDFSNTLAEQVMSAPLTFVQPHETLSHAQELMNKLRVHRLVVTNSQGLLAGIVTSTSLSRAVDLQHIYSIMEILQNKLERLSAAHYKLLEQNQFDLEDALSKGEFRMVYQPIIQLDTGLTYSAEALMRWSSPRHGHVGPDQFIPLAEGNGFIIHLGYWSLEQSCEKFNLAVPAEAPISLSVNVSGVQLKEPDFVRNTLNILDRTGFEPRRLQLELTESTFIDEELSINDIISELRSHGIKIAIDDFGTGFSSFSYLQRFSFDVLKLDRSLISSLADSTRARVIVGTMQELAERLEFKIIAEGVETIQEMKILQEIGCHGAQGYLFSRPLEIPLWESLKLSEPYPL